MTKRQLLGSPAVRMTYSDALFVMARDLSALLKISTTINAIRGLDKLQKALLDLLFEVVPARRGAILLTSTHADTGDEFSSVIGARPRRRNRAKRQCQPHHRASRSERWRALF